MQEYAASEMVEHAAEGRLTRREMLVRLVGICGSATAAAAFLAACTSDGSSAKSSSTTASTANAATTDPTSITPPTTTGTNATLSVAADDPAITAKEVEFPGPAGPVFGYYAEPVDGGSTAGIIVIHEIFGLTDHIRDVTRRVAKAGYLALAPDLASRAGGSKTATNIPGALTQGSVDDRVGDLEAGVAYLEDQPDYNGKLGAVGFCFGGGMTLSFAAAEPKVRAAVPYYGPTPDPASVMSGTKAAILAHYGADDARVDAGIPALEAALAGKTFKKHVHEGAGHAFNNDTGGAYNEQAAVTAWGETLAWFENHL